MKLYIKQPDGLMVWETEETEPCLAINDLRHQLHGFSGRILALITECPALPDTIMPDGEAA